MKWYIIIGVFVERSNARRIKKSPLVNNIIPFIKIHHPVYEKKPVFFNKVYYNMVIFNILETKHIE